MTPDIASWSGPAAFGLNILTLLFVFGYWKGKVDTKLSTLWDVYVTSILTREVQRRGHSKASSPYPPEWDNKTRGICLSLPPGQLGYKVVKRLTSQEIQKVALENGRTFGELLAEYLLTKISPTTPCPPEG